MTGTGKLAECRSFLHVQVGMRHINLAVEEMFSAAHMQTLLNCCPLEKLVLAALILETKAQGASRDAASVAATVNTTLLVKTDSLSSSSNQTFKIFYYA